ncbi:MAG: hypothetical protein ACC651_08925, partial [Candidatus Scalindua sp.]
LNIGKIFSDTINGNSGFHCLLNMEMLNITIMCASLKSLCFMESKIVYFKRSNIVDRVTTDVIY